MMMSWIAALAAAAAAAVVVDGWMGERRTRSGRMFVVRGQDPRGGTWALTRGLGALLVHALPPV